VVRDRTSGRFYEAEVRRTVFLWRGSDGEKDNERLFNSLTHVSCESEASGLGVFGDELFEPWLVDGHYASKESRDFVLVYVDAGNVNAELGKACSGHESDITRTDNGNVHLLIRVQTIKTLRVTRS
jgi:hypothetical protein